MKKLNLKNKVIYISFYSTVSFVFVFALLYKYLNLAENIEGALVIGFVLLLMLNIFFVLFVNDLIIKDIDILREKLTRVGKGILTEDFDSRRKDEIGEIFGDAKKILQAQNEIIARVRDNSEKIEESSKSIKLLIIENKDIISQLSKTLNAVQGGTKAQISGIQEVEISVEEMVVGINRINSTVGEVAENAGRAVEEALKGNTALEKVVYQMGEIRKNSENSMKTITILGEQIKEIQKIVDVIRSISSRTNLLALNATIEAERAGENGEGFIVVAEEIKDLAVKSTESTVKIEKISRNIMERKDKAIDIIEKSAKEVRDGISVVNEASQAFNKILVSTDDIGNQLNELSSSSEQLSSNTYQIVKTIEKTSSIAKDFSNDTSNVETFVEQQKNSVDKLMVSIDVLEQINAGIREFLDKLGK